MRALILAAGLGTRLRPLTLLRAKPALPVRGIPILATLLRLLDEQDIREVMINTHHLPESIHAVVERYRPTRMQVQFSHEPTLLDTGGAIRRVVDFLRDSDPCLVLAGDMLLDYDLRAFAAAHQAEGNAVTFLLSDDPRIAQFGSIGIDTQGCVRRIGQRFDLGGETARGLYLSVTAIAARALATLPERDVFSHLDAWIAPLLRAGARDIRAKLLPAAAQHLDPTPVAQSAPAPSARRDVPSHAAATRSSDPSNSSACTQATALPTALIWEPVGTVPEYLDANFCLPPVYNAKLDAWAKQEGARFGQDFVIGPTAKIGAGTDLDHVVVWDGENVPGGKKFRRGVFAGGEFHPCPADAKTTA